MYPAEEEMLDIRGSFKEKQSVASKLPVVTLELCCLLFCEFDRFRVVFIYDGDTVECLTSHVTT